MDATLWESKSSDTLSDLCITFVVKNLDEICSVTLEDDASAAGGGAAASDTIVLQQQPLSLKPLTPRIPRKLCEKLLAKMREDRLLDDRTVNIFADREKTSLKSANVRGCSALTAVGLSILVRHDLRDLDARDCEGVVSGDGDLLQLLDRHSGNLISLAMGNLNGPLVWDGKKDEDRVLRAPLLTSLVLWNLGGVEHLEPLLRPLAHLAHLDLSASSELPVGDLGDLACLRQCLPRLTSLVLYNKMPDAAALRNIAEVKTLRHLDISNSTDDGYKYDEPDETLSALVEALPFLCSLDISGTNLAGEGPTATAAAARCDILGLESRVDNPLNFLGLFRTDGACKRARIPAQKISGVANVHQVLEAGRRYLDCTTKFALSIILSLPEKLKDINSVDDFKTAIELNLQTMSKFPKNLIIQIIAPDSLCKLLTTPLCILCPPNVKLEKKMLTAVLTGMFEHKDHPIVVMQGIKLLSCLICHRISTEDMLFEFDRIKEILWHSLTLEVPLAGAFSFFASESIQCLGELRNKMNKVTPVMNSADAIDKLLAFVTKRFNSDVDDDLGLFGSLWLLACLVMEDTANTDRILAAGGKDLIRQIKEKFPGDIRPEMLYDVLVLREMRIKMEAELSNLMKANEDKVVQDD